MNYNALSPLELAKATELFEQMHQARIAEDLAAVQRCKLKLFHGYAKFASWIADKFSKRSSIEKDDLLQQTMVELWSSLDKVNLEHEKVNIRAFLRSRIEWKLLKYQQCHTTTVRIPIGVQHASVRVEKSRNHWFKNYGTQPTDDDLINSGVDESDIRLAEWQIRPNVNLNGTVGDDSNETFLDRLEDSNAHDAVEAQPDLAKAIKFLSRLKPRQSEILYRRWGGETLEQISDDMGVTRERIRQIESGALRRLCGKKDKITA